MIRKHTANNVQAAPKVEKSILGQVIIMHIIVGGLLQINECMGNKIAKNVSMKHFPAFWLWEKKLK